MLLYMCTCWYLVVLQCYFYFFMPPSKKGVLLCTCRSVCPSVTFSFQINNSRTPWPSFINLCPHICSWQQMNPIDFMVTGTKVKVIRVKCWKNISNQILEIAMTHNPQTWSTHPSWIAYEPYCFWVRLGSNLTKLFQIV